MTDLVALRPTGRGAALLVAGLAALAGARVTGLVALHALAVLLLALVGVTAAGAVACGVGLRLGPARSCRWQVPDHLQEGQAVTCTAELALPWWCLDPVVTVRARLELPGEHAGDHVGDPALSAVAKVVPDGAGQTTVTLSAGARGLLRLDLVRLETTGLLGLWRLRSPVRVSVSRPVRPRGMRATSAGVRVLAGEGGGHGRAAGAAELGRLRPYQPGDAVSRVHWRQSARVGGLVVVEPEGGDGVLRVVLDRRLGTYRSRQEAEDAVRVAAGWVAEHGGPLRLQCLPAWEEPAGVLDAAAALDLLARVPLVAGEPADPLVSGGGPGVQLCRATGPECAEGLRAGQRRGARHGNVAVQVTSAFVVLGTWWAGLDSLTLVLRPGTWQASAFAVLTAAVLGGLAARLACGRSGRGGVLRRRGPAAAVTIMRSVAAAAVCALLAGAVVVAVLDPPRWWLHRPLRLLGDAVDLAQRYQAPMPVDLTTTLVIVALAAVAGTVTVLVGALGGDRTGLTVLLPGTCQLAAPLAAELPVTLRDLVAQGVCLAVLVLLHVPRASGRPAARLRAVAAQVTLACTALVLAGILTPLTPAGRTAVADRLAGILAPSTAASASAPSRAATSPTVSPAAPTGATPTPAEGGLTGEAAGGVVPDLTVALDHDLLTAPDVPVLAYRTSDRFLSGEEAYDSGLGTQAGAAPRLVLGVVRDLGGQAWTTLEETDGVPVTDPPPGTGLPGAWASRQPGNDDGTPATVPPAAILEDARAQAAARQALPVLEVRVLALRSAALPVLSQTVAVQPASGTPAAGPTAGRSTLAPWEWVSEAGTALAHGEHTQEGMAYTVTGWSPSLGYDGTVLGTPDAGADASVLAGGTGPDAASGPGHEPDWLVPYREVDEDLVAAVGPWAAEALELTGTTDAPPLEQAAVLASWFHGNGFVYDAAAPGTLDGQDGTPAQVLTEFVRTRHGYCIHYAAAFTVMARSVGIPTRIAVGLAPGAAAWREADGEGWVPVSARSLHAWPQVWDPASGWVSLEPTPGAAGGVSAPGAVHAFSSQDPDGVPSPARLTPVEASTPGVQEAALDREPASTSQHAPTMVIGVVVVGLLLVGGIGYRRWRGGPRRRQGSDGPVEVAWRVGLRAAQRQARAAARASGGVVPRPRALTEQAEAEALAAFLTPEEAAALTRLADAVVAERYGTEQSTVADEG